MMVGFCDASHLLFQVPIRSLIRNLIVPLGVVSGILRPHQKKNKK